MYDLVVLKNMGMYITSVFDERNNEIWNNKTFYDLVVPDLKKQKFTIDNVLYDDRSSSCVDLLVEHDLFDNYRVNMHNVDDVLQDDDPIANECGGIYGYARYLHRMLRKDLKTKAC